MIAHDAERKWVRCIDKEAKGGGVESMVKKRRMYKRAAGRAKRHFEESRRNEPQNSSMRNPR